MSKKVSIVLVGINGYGNIYLNDLLDDNKRAFIKGVVDIKPESSENYQRIVDKRIPIYHSLKDFYKNTKADLAIISTPIHLHKEQSCYAMQHGSNVLCEKPISGKLFDIKEMIRIRNETDKFLAIGFNWSFTDSVQQLKKDILNGAFGKPKRMKSLVLWPRNDDYYARSSWAGKKYDSNGNAIFDSIANNATAHFLHHMFYLLGDTIDNSCKLKEVSAELYRANDIETFDTCAVCAYTTANTEVLFYASHAVEKEINPQFVFEFEHATVTYKPKGEKKNVIAHFNNGDFKEYADPENDHLAKLRVCINAVINQTGKILCGPEAAIAHTSCIQAMHDSVPSIPVFPIQSKKYKESIKQWQVEGLEDLLLNCYDNWVMPAESNFSSCKRGNNVKLT